MSARIRELADRHRAGEVLSEDDALELRSFVARARAAAPTPTRTVTAMTKGTPKMASRFDGKTGKALNDEVKKWCTETLEDPNATASQKSRARKVLAVYDEDELEKQDPDAAKAMARAFSTSSPLGGRPPLPTRPQTSRPGSTSTTRTREPSELTLNAAETERMDRAMGTYKRPQARLEIGSGDREAARRYLDELDGVDPRERDARARQLRRFAAAAGDD